MIFSCSIISRRFQSIHSLQQKEKQELASLIKKGNQEAYRELICANLRLVVKIARKYANYELSVPDLIAEGNIGLMKAAIRFDPTKKIKFSTNAS